MLTLNGFNGDYITRDKIIFGKYDPSKYSGGCRRFECDFETMEKLYDLGFIDPYECQNLSPSTEWFMNAARDHDVQITFECYAISPERGDYRVTIEGADVGIALGNYDDICYFIRSFNGADELDSYTDDKSFHIHAWWD